MKENVGFSNFSQRRASYLLINADLVTFTEEILNGNIFCPMDALFILESNQMLINFLANDHSKCVHFDETKTIKRIQLT